MKRKFPLLVLLAAVTAVSAIVLTACGEASILSFDANGGSECTSLTLDDAGEKTLPVSTLDGYEFAGWYFDNETFADKLSADMLADGSIKENTTVYAKWEKKAATEFTVTLMEDGAATDSFSVGAGETFAEPDYPVKAGYAFDGWYKDAALTTVYDFTAPVTGDCALYGKFLQETVADKFVFEVADDYFGVPCYGITGVAAGAELPADLVIPASYDSEPVVCLFAGAFKQRTDVKSVYIPDSVTTICQGAFNECTSLAEVRMSRNIAEAGDGAFYKTALYNAAADGYIYVGSVLADYKGAVPADFTVSVKEGTRVVADRVFWLNTDVTKVELPASLVYVGFNAFLRAPVTEYTVPAAGEHYAVKDGALFSKDMTELVYYPVGSDRTSYTVPDSVVRIGDEAFQHVYHLVSVVIPDSVQTIGDGVFDESQTLEEVTFGAGIESVGDGLFNAPNALKRIIVKAATPFPYGVFFLDGSGVPMFDIFVADEYLETYKTAANWSGAATRMKPLSKLAA